MQYGLSKLKAIGTTGIMVLAVFAVLLPTVMSQGPRATTGELLPKWDVNNFWKYRYDDIILLNYILLSITMNDTPYLINVDIEMTPTNHVNIRSWTCAQVNKSSIEYKMTYTIWSSENGTYKMIITGNGGDPSPSFAVGTVLESGTYNNISTTNGDVYIDTNSLNIKRDTMQVNTKITAGTGIRAWALTKTDQITDWTSNGINAQYKPTWNTAPMKIGDSWVQTNLWTTVDVYNESLSGSLSGSDKGTITQNIHYMYSWTVAGAAKKTITYTGGQINFPNAYQITLNSGSSFNWDVADDQGHKSNGHQSAGMYELWYGGDGDSFDCGWGIEFNKTGHVTACTYVAFVDTPPVLGPDAPQTVTINSEQVWNFGNGTNFTITPGAYGQISYSLKNKALGTNTNVLKDLTITPDTGQISYTPGQKDVADGYTITINATDNYPKGPMGVDYTFKLNIKDSNHPPMAVPNIISNFTISEGDAYKPSWKLSNAFHDSDMDANPLMNGQPYNLNETLTYSVSYNGSVRVLCNGNDMIPSNQCPSSGLSFQAIDGKFPWPSIPVDMTITATDRVGLKATALLTVAVTHVNHKPYPVKAKQTFTMEEGGMQTIDLRTWFKDQDVNSGDPNYQTFDTLSYEHSGEKHITVIKTGTKARLWFDTSTDKLANHWNGQEDISFTAIDKAGAKSDPVVATIIITPVIQPPFVVSVTPTTDPTIDETDDGTETGHVGSIKLTIIASDYDNTVGVNQNQVISFNWTVEDDAQNVYKVDTHDNMYTFTAAFNCDFTNGKFCGETKYGDTSRTYYVTAYVTDGTFDVEAHKWYVTVKDIPRTPVISGIDVFTVVGTNKVPLTATSPGNYTISYGKVLEFDVTNQIIAPDLGIDKGQGTNIDKLTFKWTSNLVGSLGQTAKIDVGAGSKSGTATMALGSGKAHIITVKVSQGSLSATYAITVKVAKKSIPDIPGFESVVFVVSIGVAVALIAYGRRK